MRAVAREPGGVDWLVVSIVLSVVLTVVLNVALRAFPGIGDAFGPKLDELTSRGDQRSGDRRVHVWFRWKAMLLASLTLTVALNLLLWAT